MSRGIAHSWFVAFPRESDLTEGRARDRLATHRIPALSRCVMGATWLMIVFQVMSVMAADVDYLRDVKPLLTAKCVACHGGLRQKGQLRLDTAKFALQGGDSGPAIMAGDSGKSPLIEAVLGANGRTKMPIDGEELKPEQIELLRRWIDSGAKAPADESVADPRDHWAFQKPVQVAISNLRSQVLNGNSELHNPIDVFLAVEHQRLGITPLAESDRATLLRRVTLDLIGIPPTRDELLAFQNDRSPDAYERVVDRLLKSPLHAQRWAKHWMDIWRYSDWYGSRGGNELRNSRRHIWRWRDWIIESLANDKGFDRMIIEMLAADELAPGDRDVQRASGFLGRNYYVFNRHVWLQDTVEFTGAAFLGLTFKCARCHDHKYDPISQEEYYRFRAIFEPHNVRTDQVVGKPEEIKGQIPAGAAPGVKLADGFDVVYDADLAVPTYLLARGNEKNPVTDKPLTPGVPSVFGSTELPINPVSLPLEASYPDLRAERRHELLADARAAVSKAESDAAKAHADAESARAKLQSSNIAPDNGNDVARPPATAPFLDDNFAEQRQNVWQILSGDWHFEDKKLRLKTPGHFTTIATTTNHPQDFKATIKYRTLSGGSIGSVGLFFDMVEHKSAQAVYTAIGTGNSTVQAFHRINGSEVYPAAGIVPAPVKVNEDTTLEIIARGQELRIWLNGELKLTYQMPTPRQPGRFALWCHAGVAEFHSVRVVANELTADELKLALRAAEAQAALSAKVIEIARQQLTAVEARITAEVAKYHNRVDAPNLERPDVNAVATEASRAERQVAVAKAELEVLRAEQQFDSAKAAATSDNAKSQDAIKAAEPKLAAARQAVEAAKTNAAKVDTNYTPIGPTYPITSTGRRLAFARWLTSRENPLTARVAVNHVWRRHFGSALVPSVANFGLNGKKPTHPELLDWLAVEFMESGWSLRHLHRLIVTSAAYRRASGESFAANAESTNVPDRSPPADHHAQRLRDHNNRTHWRANPQRMEAEVVRDSLLAFTGRLDPTHTGPELEPSSADSSTKRSLFFRLTPDDQATMLELFDGPLPAECFERSESIVPQQALSLANSPVALTQSRLIARELSQAAAGAASTSDTDFIRAAFETVLCRQPQNDELTASEQFLGRQSALLAEPTKLTRTTTGLATAVPPSADPRQRARENLVHVLLNHQDFVTIR